MSMPVFLTISGAPGSGKSTVAKALEAQRKALIVSFGAPVKARVNATDPYVRDAIRKYGEADAKHDPRVRKAYQDEGEAVAQFYGEGCLAAKASGQIIQALKSGRSVVADDCRRVEELELGQTLLTAGLTGFVGLTLRVERPGIPTPDHPLELRLDKHQHALRLINNASEEALIQTALRLWDSLPGEALRRQREANSIDSLLDGMFSSDPLKQAAAFSRALRACGY